MSGRTLLLLDGTGLFYRSFFAIKGLTAHDGQPTNAVYGFVRALHQMVEMWRPTHLAVVWDGGTPQERLTLLPEYKAQRPPMPDALRSQTEPLREFFALAGVPFIRMERQEADDILATLARWAVPDAESVLVASSDKDLYQLVTDRIQVIHTGKDDTRVGRADVFERTGVYPEQIVEWLALTGDSVDNIPGIEGMGPKTAARLLGQFGSLAAMWGRLHEVGSERLRVKLEENRALVDKNLALVRLRDDLSCPRDWEALAFKPEDPDLLRPFYERMDFRSLVKRTEQRELF
jgi:DNA polymerase-1